MSAINYARRGGGKRDRTPLEVRFFAEGDEIPRSLLQEPWVWWAVPRDYHEVQLVGETKLGRFHRLKVRMS